MSQDLRPFFYPRHVAVIGASENPRKIGHEILKNIQAGGFSGNIYPVNPTSSQILGIPCYAGIDRIPGPVDLAVVVIPAGRVPQAIAECGKKGVPAAVIITGGFSEAGAQGEALQKQTIEAAKRHGVRLIGPNCQGLNNPHASLCASWPLLTLRGKVAVISQSGTVGAAMMDWFSIEGLGVSSFVSMGNRSDVDESDLIAWFQNDPGTEVIALYLEGIKDVGRFQRAVANTTKPLVVLKSGRTAGGKVAAESHTRSLAGADAVYDALFRQSGICRAQTIEEFYDFSKAMAYLKPPAGNRVLFITTSGGAAILATDAAEREGLSVPPLPEELADALEGVIPAHAIRRNPLDLTGDADAAMFAKVMERSRPYYDVLGVIFGDPIQNAAEVVTAGASELIIFLGGAEVEHEERMKMHRKGIPVFPTPERGIRALSQAMPAGLKTRPAQTTFPEASGRKLSGFFESISWLAEKGMPCVKTRLAKNADEAVIISEEIGYPVVLKVESPDLIHKSDAGGVRLNLASGAEVRDACERLFRDVKTRNPEARINGIAVSSMARPGLELILGMRRDSQFGPVLMFGLGGIGVEVFRDVSLRLMPFSRNDALAMMSEIRGAAMLSGFRNTPPVDRNALADALVRLSELARDHEEIAEMDLNPVIARPDGILIVDARIIRA